MTLYEKYTTSLGMGLNLRWVTTSIRLLHLTPAFRTCIQKIRQADICKCFIYKHKNNCWSHIQMVRNIGLCGWMTCVYPNVYVFYIHDLRKSESMIGLTNFDPRQCKFKSAMYGYIYILCSSERQFHEIVWEEYIWFILFNPTIRLFSYDNWAC